MKIEKDKLLASENKLFPHNIIKRNYNNSIAEFYLADK